MLLLEGARRGSKPRKKKEFNFLEAGEFPISKIQKGKEMNGKKKKLKKTSEL